MAVGDPNPCSYCGAYTHVTPCAGLLSNYITPPAVVYYPWDENSPAWNAELDRRVRLAIEEYEVEQREYEMERPTWMQYFLDLAKLAAKRATCPVRQVGAVFVDPGTNVVLATGYNGSPRGTPHCGKACYERQHGEKTSECRAVHAETNGIYSAARRGVSLEGAHVYCTLSPCVNCARALVQVGITWVGYGEDSAYPEAIEELKMGGVGYALLSAEVTS